MANPVFFVGLSGPSSSGKTTLAHLLSAIFPNVVQLIHGDDFCKEFEDIPMTSYGYLDADGPGGVDFINMAATLDYVRSHDGTTSDDFSSWQADVFKGQDKKALSMVDPATLDVLRKAVKDRGITAEAPKLVIVDGFMLYNIEEIRRRIDLRLFIRLSHKTAQSRRFNRPNYGAEAKEGEFWKTEDYFEKMVWRNYVEQQGQFFNDGNVEGSVNENLCKEKGVDVQDGMDVNVESTLQWAVHKILDFLPAVS